WSENLDLKYKETTFPVIIGNLINKGHSYYGVNIPILFGFSYLDWRHLPRNNILNYFSKEPGHAPKLINPSVEFQQFSIRNEISNVLLNTPKNPISQVYRDYDNLVCWFLDRIECKNLTIENGKTKSFEGDLIVDGKLTMKTGSKLKLNHT